MNTPTYKQQFDKITEAYIKGDIKPYNAQFCFCGTIGYDYSFIGWDYHLYSTEEYKEMEFALLDTIRRETKGKSWGTNIYLGEIGDSDRLRGAVLKHPNYENALFNGMVAALEVLKKIHISRGEAVDEAPAFQKRTLTPELNK